jgi:hypothetical protein
MLSKSIERRFNVNERNDPNKWSRMRTEENKWVMEVKQSISNQARKLKEAEAAKASTPIKSENPD